MDKQGKAKRKRLTGKDVTYQMTQESRDWLMSFSGDTCPGGDRGFVRKMWALAAQGRPLTHNMHAALLNIKRGYR